jgi:hypothetical protein
LVSDPAALQYILAKSGYEYTKQYERLIVSQMMAGRGVGWATGAFWHGFETWVSVINFLKVIITNDNVR